MSPDSFCLQHRRASCKSTSALEGMLRGDKSVLVFLTGHEGMLLYFGSFGTDVSSSILAERNNPSQLIIIILYASVLVFLTGVGPLQLNDETMKKSSLRELK